MTVVVAIALQLKQENKKSLDFLNHPRYHEQRRLRKLNEQETFPGIRGVDALTTAQRPPFISPSITTLNP